MCSTTIAVQRLVLVLWITTVLTSFVDSVAKTDSLPSELTSQVNSANGSAKSDQQSPDPVAEPLHESVNRSVQTNKIPTHASFVVEGGPISVSSTASTAFRTTLQLSNSSESLTSDKVTVKHENNDYNAGRSNTSKIVPRKGADLATAVFHDNKSTPDGSIVVEGSYVTTLSSRIVQSDATLAVLPNVNTKNLGLSQQNLTANSTTNVHVASKHKPKPTATIGSSDVDQPISVFSPKGSFFGMPKKMDYIVPVVVTVIVAPLMVAATYVVYRKGRDCWDKRHYRRMDFLIDGMYND